MVPLCVYVCMYNWAICHREDDYVFIDNHTVYVDLNLNLIGCFRDKR